MSFYIQPVPHYEPRFAVPAFAPYLFAQHALGRGMRAADGLVEMELTTDDWDMFPDLSGCTIAYLDTTYPEFFSCAVDV